MESKPAPPVQTAIGDPRSEIADRLPTPSSEIIYESPLPPTPGPRTTEFWLTVATNVAALIMALAGALPPREAAIAMAVANGLYAIARGWAKSGRALGLLLCAALAGGCATFPPVKGQLSYITADGQRVTLGSDGRSITIGGEFRGAARVGDGKAVIALENPQSKIRNPK